MTQCLVTGAAGFIGGHLTRALLDRGYSVRGLDNFSTGMRSNLAGVSGDFDLIEGDMCDPSVSRKAVEGAEIVFHQAAIPSVARSVEDPVGTTHNNIIGATILLDEARKAGVRRFVYAASSSAYGDQPDPVKIESMPPAPRSPYAVAKLAAEQMCKAAYHTFGLSTICLRYFNIFGPRQDPNSPYSAVVPLFIKALLSGQKPRIEGDGLQTRDFTYIDNAVQANIRAGETDRGAGVTINIACGDSFSIKETLEKLAALAGVPPEAQYVDPRPGDVRHSLASIDKARELIGYDVSVKFDEGLRRTFEYFRDAGQE